MVRRAVVFGSNGPDQPNRLRYAVSDSERMRAALAGPRCGFDVSTPPDLIDPQAIERFLSLQAETCGSDDTLLVFFSGHGVTRGSDLLLMLDKTEVVAKPLSSALRAEAVVNCLRTSRARHKVLILDCCHAGMVYQDSRFKDAGIELQSVVDVKRDADDESFVAIVASDRLEQTRELDEIGGSFLTWAVCDALGAHFESADAGRDGAIDLDDLKAWLQKAAADHNSRGLANVPTPFIFGRQRGTVYLTLAPTEWSLRKLIIDGLPFVVLPYLTTAGDEAWAISTTPVTNAQYADRKMPAPKGFDRSMVNDRANWDIPIEPWSDPRFNGPDLPVVCVSLPDCIEFASRVSKAGHHAWVAPPDVWDFAAFGRPYPELDRRAWVLDGVHDCRSGRPFPAAVNRPDASPNKYGAVDLLGNVWEWTDTGREGGGLSRQELRGGGFVNDMSNQRRPTFLVNQLKGKQATRHTDVGFRLATRVRLSEVDHEPASVAISAATREDLHWRYAKNSDPDEPGSF